MTRGGMGARAPNVSVSSGPLETVVLLGTVSLELTGSFQAPGHQISPLLIEHSNLAFKGSEVDRGSMDLGENEGQASAP